MTEHVPSSIPDMGRSTNSQYAKAVLLDAYYDLRARAAIGEIPDFILGDYKMGYDFIVTSPDGNTVGDIPGNTANIGGIFRTGTPQYGYANGRTAIRVEFPQGTVPSGQKKQFSVTGIYTKPSLNELGTVVVPETLIAVMASVPQELTEVDELIIDGYIDNTLQGQGGTV